MPPKSKWGRGIEIHKTNLGFPRRLWEAARIRALKEGRNLEELVAEAVSDYLRKVKRGGRNA
jgi:hypothetical protein